MLFLLTLTLLSVVTVGSVVAYQRGAVKRLEGGDDERPALPAAVEEPEEGPATDRTLETLVVGDVVIDGDEDWLIVGTLTYREEDERWFVHRLDSGAKQRWLEVRDRGGYVATWLEPATDVPSFGQLYDGLTHKGRPFRLWRRGDARVTTDGEVDGRGAGIVRYTAYEGPGGAYLNVEEVEGKRVALSGERVVGVGLTLMPGKRPVAADPDEALFRLD